MELKIWYDEDDDVEPCESDSIGLGPSVTSELVNAGKNIYFVQIGINPNGLTPVGCAIDHSSIDWDTLDLTGGFGDDLGISYNADSFFGVNFYKADNETPLGLHETCSNTSTGDYVDRYGLYTYTYAVPDPTHGSYKTIFGGWWGDTYWPVHSSNLVDGSYCSYLIMLKYPASVIWLGTAVNELYLNGEVN